MLRKLVISNWVHVSSGLVLEDGRRMVKSHVPIWGDLLGGRFKCGKMGLPSHRKRKKNFFIKNSLGHSTIQKRLLNTFE